MPNGQFVKRWNIKLNTYLKNERRGPNLCLVETPLKNLGLSMMNTMCEGLFQLM